LAMLIVSAQSLALIAVRLVMAEPSRAYFFLAWNLLLAWIPYILGLLLFANKQNFISYRTLLPIILLWLLFFPNAPYIVTDFFHFNQKPNVSVWFDLLMLISFAWSGLLLGLVSLRDVHVVITQKTNRTLGWLFAGTSILCGAVGVYMGRYLRWNTWDLFIDPIAFLNDLVTHFIYPTQDSRAWGLTVTFSLFLCASYLAFLLLMRHQPTDS
jgi:uncharacterized membrane protein